VSVEDVVGRGGVADILGAAQTQRHRERNRVHRSRHTDSVCVSFDRTPLISFRPTTPDHPSAVVATVAAWRAQDYEQMIPLAAARDVAWSVIRALAAARSARMARCIDSAKRLSSLARAEVDADR